MAHETEELTSSAALTESDTHSDDEDSDRNSTTNALDDGEDDSWHVVTTESGQIYYWNSITNETSWDPPNSLQSNEGVINDLDHSVNALHHTDEEDADKLALNATIHVETKLLAPDVTLVCYYYYIIVLLNYFLYCSRNLQNKLLTPLHLRQLS